MGLPFFQADSSGRKTKPDTRLKFKKIKNISFSAVQGSSARDSEKPTERRGQDADGLESARAPVYLAGDLGTYFQF